MIIIKLKIIILILILTFFIPIGLCEKVEDIKELNNTKIYDKNDKIISIYDKNNEKSMNIKLISTTFDIDKLIKIVEITNYIEYIPNEKQDFITKTKKVYGKNDIYKIEYFIEKYNYTFENIIINKIIFNNKTGKNETILINKSIIKNIKPFWIEFNPYDKEIFKNEKFKLKIIHYKKPELGFFKIQTIPIFKNIECKEFTWWDGNWNLKRPILINNTNGDHVIDYQLKSVNLSQYQINASSARIINESSGLQENFWNESIDSNGNLKYVWCNFSEILNNTWVNETYYIYYQSVPNVNSVSNSTNTFLEFWDFEDNTLQGFSAQSSTAVTSAKSKRGSYSVSLYDGSSIGGQRGELKRTDFNYQSGVLDFDMWIPELIGTIANRVRIEDGSTIVYLHYVAAATERVYCRNSIGSNVDYSNGAYIYPVDGWRKNSLRFKESSSYLDAIINKTYLGTGYKYNTGTIDTLTFSSGASTATGQYGWVDDIRLRKYTLNEPELWTVGNIEYPEALDMNCSLKIITHLTNKNIKIVDMNGSIIKENSTNECINLSYDSYMIYMSNPVKISSFTELLNTIDNVFIQFFLFAFLIVIGIIFFTFLQIIKNRGFKGVTK